MIIGVPVVDGHEYTDRLLKSLGATMRGPLPPWICVIDNASSVPYRGDGFNLHRFFGRDLLRWPRLDVVRIGTNRGFYFPLTYLQKFDNRESIVGLLHNDLIFYENGWDLRVEEAFAADPKLALIGFCGSREVDENGGRGGGTMCHFRGEVGQSQAAGERITDLRPSLVLDSMAMIFRRECIPLLGIDDDITLCHFYDKIWPMRLIAQGWHVATLGVEIDHLGGVTSANEYRFGADCWRWWAERGKRYADPDMEMYLEAERRFLSEFRSWMPCSIDESYTIHRHVLAQ